MAHKKRLSQSITSDRRTFTSENQLVRPLEADAESWTNHWSTVYAKELLDSRLVWVDAETSVEDACEILLSENIMCLAIKAQTSNTKASTEGSRCIGLFDFSDVNAFLTLAATRHTLLADELRDNPRVENIVSAARAGRVPVHLVSNLSEKNPLISIPCDATIVSLLEVFSKGTHTVLIKSGDKPEEYLGMISDRQLLSWFASYVESTPSFQQYLDNPLSTLPLPSLNINSGIVAVTSTSSVLDAMRLMNEEGVSSVAVQDRSTGTLLSAVSVTDIGKIVVPSQSNHILSTAIHNFVSQIKASEGFTDGEDKYPVYSVTPLSTMLYTLEKLLATNAHRLFITRESESGVTSPILSDATGNICGIVSIVDILCLFARVAKINNIDPTSMQRRRRASSSSSSHSSRSEREFFMMSRPSSRTSMRQSPSVIASPKFGASNLPVSGIDVISIGRRVSLRKDSK